jgi:hypothetical protein
MLALGFRYCSSVHFAKQLAKIDLSVLVFETYLRSPNVCNILILFSILHILQAEHFRQLRLTETILFSTTKK